MRVSSDVKSKSPTSTTGGSSIRTPPAKFSPLIVILMRPRPPLGLSGDRLNSPFRFCCSGVGLVITMMMIIPRRRRLLRDWCSDPFVYMPTWMCVSFRLRLHITASDLWSERGREGGKEPSRQRQQSAGGVAGDRCDRQARGMTRVVFTAVLLYCASSIQENISSIHLVLLFFFCSNFFFL